MTTTPFAETHRIASRGLLALALLAALAAPALAAGYTTFNIEGPPPAVLGCLDNPTGVDCNNYETKFNVFMSGGPATGNSGLPDGTYFFAVLVPGSQNGGFIDGQPGNLSDTTAWLGTHDDGSGDDVANRTFTVANHEISGYGGTHEGGVSSDHTGNRRILQLMPYDDTENNGGVYILAICVENATDPSECKFDAFRVQPAETGGALTVLKNASPSFARKYLWTIDKSVDAAEVHTAGGATVDYTVSVSHDAGTDQGWTVEGTITVNNPNDFEVNGVDVSDTVDDPNASCTVSNGTGRTVGANDSFDVDYSCTYSQAPASSSETNTVTVTWPDPLGEDQETSATFSIEFAFPADPAPIDGCVTVTDPMATDPPLPATVCVGDANPTELTYSVTFTDPAGTCTSHENTATATTDTTETSVSDSATVEVCVGADLEVSKTAATAFTRTYGWSIDKQASPPLVEQIGGTATFNYKVIVTRTGFVDSGWTVSGTISVHNPNDWEAITADLTDAVGNGGSCMVTGGASVVVAAGGTESRSYTCTYAAPPNPASGTNTATATWDASAAATPSGSAQGTASFAFGAPTTEVNRCVTVEDTFDGTKTTLGTVCDSTTFSYSHTVAVPQWNCRFYDNTARIVETGQTDSERVEVCGPAKTGALTMGFWQNKNGQGIITAGASTATVCNSGTFLRSYPPFQDLGATASCSQVATYAYHLIKAASASGATMNAMLKAQMLATALDVYFSGPGGNKIGAPAPVGAVTIDLTKICKMIDGSGGTATCSGTYQNVSPAFGGATSLTVSQILSYAGSQSNAGGGVWYGQVKATQELAKNTFDAINNQVAFSP
jgi:hypothetical protein